MSSSRYEASSRSSARNPQGSRTRSPPSSANRGRDRMAELSQASGFRPPRSNSNAYEMNDMGNGDARVQQFLDQIASLDSSLKRIQSSLNYIEKTQRRAGDGRLPEAEQEKNRKALEQATLETQATLTDYRSKFQVLETKLSQFTPGTANFVMCANQLTTLRKKHLGYVSQFQQLEKNYSGKQKEKLLKELRVIHPNATEDDLHQLNNGQFFKQTMLQSNRYGQQALHQVKERHEEIQKIESTVEEVAELFLELSSLIQQQDFVVENIVQHADETVVNLEKGGEEVDKAIVQQRSNIKLK
ncbi:Plasma membrane t-SNARE, secretory vesicle fusion, partial [Coelomomyces lativittatus]